MSIDIIGNFLTIIRNGLMRSKGWVVIPYSKMKFDVAHILKEEGFINDAVVVDEDVLPKGLKIFLKYVDGESVIHSIQRVSKPGCRYYEKATNLKPVVGNLGISILTTSRGIMTNKRAKELGVGGEVLCTVW